MPIPLSQLNTWANQGGTTASSAAYAGIRNALLKSTSPLASKTVDIFLQGSYANATNIYGDSDVDVVVLYPDTFFKDMSALGPLEQQRHESIFPLATYQWINLRNDVLRALQSQYGTGAVTAGKKSIKVVTGSGRKPSDVVPAVQFRKYASFVNQNNMLVYWGILFFDSSNSPIINYPKYHIQRGENKNQVARTGGRYKPTIRVFKKFRNYLVDHGLLLKGIAPSYCIECALYNVTDGLFIGQLTTTIPAIIKYLLYTPYAGFLCQNGVTPLIGDGSTQWSLNGFSTFVVAAQLAWDNWK